ncbi:MAG: hypothetical protein PGN12_01955 [Sphingomonas phyllosphaerae]
MSVAATIVVGVSAYINDLPIAALVPMCFGVLALIVVLPFPALERVRRSRVMVACIFYTAATALSCVIANMMELSVGNLLLSIAPLSGIVLSIWALRTWNRRRKIGFSDYYDT